jgi:5-methylcytosine-specific restriction endonuclease McrA
MMGSQAKLFGFGGRRHSEASKHKIAQNRKGKAQGNQNAKGYQHTIEARKLISKASKKLWSEQRDKMIASLPNGEDNPMYRGNNRYLREFTPRQKREWTEKSCLWCGTTEDLQLDHIIPVWMQELRIRENAQTLCRRCNIMKRQFIETPMYHAFQAAKGTKN